MDFLDDNEDEIIEDTEQTLARLRQAPLVSLNYVRELQQMIGWKPLSLEDYAFKLKATQREKDIKNQEDSRKIINDRVKRQNRLTDKKKD